MAAAKWFLGTVLMVVFLPVVAHPGGLNREGCHNDRKNGAYHCHSGGDVDGSSGAASLRSSSLGFAPATAARGRSGRVFRNCDEARSAGAAPVRRGDPGYGQHLDRDNDGIGCEPYRGRR